MSPPIAILLPGLHGTTELFDRFVAAAPATVPLRCQPLPNDAPLGYEALAEWVAARLPPDRVVLIAESFSGPLALFVADRCPNVVGLVLCVTFVRPPAPVVVAHLPRRMWSVTPPLPLIRTFLTGGDRPLAAAVQRTVRNLSGAIIAHRIASALHVDATAELRRFAKPLLSLRATRDWIVPTRSAEAIRTLKPTATFVDLDGPHMLLQTRSMEAWHHIWPFMERVEEQ